MIADKYLPYRGEIKGIAGVGGTLAFVTLDPETRAGGLYRLDADALDLAAADLSVGAVALAAVGGDLWLAGADGQLSVSSAGGAPLPRGGKLAGPAAALVPLADGRLAALVGAQVVILATKDGKTLQALDLPEPGSALAADPTGRWLVAGGTKGTIAVFDGEGPEGFVAGGSGRPHEAAVAAILFEPDDLRFFSTSADGKLLSTHARGQLEPEDKGRGNNHSDLVAGLIWGPGDRLLSGSRDGSIKSWPRAGGVKPSTIKDGVGRVVGLAIVTVHDRPRLVAACDDNTLRVFPLDPAGKVGDLTVRVHDAHAAARHELRQAEAPRREAALRALAGVGDGRSVELIAEQAGADADHALRLLAAEALAASGHPKAPPLLEGLLTHRDEAVRVAAFRGLRRVAGASSLRPIDLALRAEKPDVGRLAVEALIPLAREDDQALARLVAALDARTPEVRQAALLALESAHPADSPEANLVALGSKHVDVRRAALVRLHRRQLLADPAVQSAIHRALEDADPTIRQVAFLLSLQGRSRLLATLRARDAELERQLGELEGTPAADAARPAPKPKKGKVADSAADGPPGPDDVEPLLQASAARALDTSLRGARGLAILGDPRAFGLLLQLSREDDHGARAEVCRALAALDDPRAVERLRSLIHDGAPAVRDAAFTALEQIHQADPLLAAEAGLDATHEDVRRRGLQALVAHAREPGRLDACRQLLARALNDGFPGVRSEAFKAALGLKVDGAGAGPLRFAARSIHADVRLEVLVEVQAQIAEPWGLDLLLTFFDDPDPGLRDLAFDFAIKKSKGLEFLDAALGSRHPDLRMKAVEGLIKKHTAAAQKLLARALDDEDKGVRRAALTALVDADALPALAPALANAHPDVRLRAAKAFARHGDGRALDPLVALATAPEPDRKERQGEWLELAESALDGLGELGDPAAIPRLIPALDSPHAALRREAALALARTCTPDRADPLRRALGHADPEVSYRAAYGLACLGDNAVAALVFSEAGGRIISTGGQVAAALALGDAGEGRLVLFLDHPKAEVRSRALLLLLMREWKDPRGDFARALAALASRTSRLRLVAARAVEALADPGAFPRFVAELINDRGDAPAWKVPAATVDALAELLVHGDHHLQVRTARLLRHLDADEQAAFDQAWRLHEARFAAALADLRQLAGKRPAVAPRYDAAQLHDLAFGAYVGLVREPSGTRPAAAAPQQQRSLFATDDQGNTIRARQSALAHLLELARDDPRHARGAVPVFVQALGDPAQAVRFQAFDQLQALALAPARLAAEALESGFVDLGVKGLELLTTGVSAEEGRAILEQAMLGRADDLAGEAARLLIARIGAAPVAARALGAASEKLRREAVGWLAAESDRDPAARDALRRALSSRYAAVREAAAFELASRKDAAAFEALAGLLAAATEAKPQRRAIAAMEALGDPRGAAALLDRAATDPTGTALLDDLIRAAGRFRDPASADRLLALFDREPRAREAAFAALVMVSGYDQPIADPDDERPDDRWLRDQHPRRDDLLARLVDRFAAPGDAKLLARLLPGARWGRSAAVGPALAAVAGHPDEATRRGAVEALGWRLRKRAGDPEPLRRALGHRDPGTQFLAAEGLALAGRPDGLNVLLASIDFASDLDLRRRAVLALGELGDEGAFDAVLKLANEDGHALQEAAAEAIGHLGRSPRGAEAFKVLERQARGDGGVAEAALRGLRWLGTRPAWRIIRDHAADPSGPHRDLAVELLGFDDADDPATGDLLLKLLAGDTSDDLSLDAILEGARRVFGPDSLEPDYATLGNPNARWLDDFDQVIERVQGRGDPARIFAILPKCPDEARADVAGCLLNRVEPPILAARGALDSPDAAIATLAAQLLGRAGPAARDSAGALASALGRWRAAWEEARAAENLGAQHRSGAGQLAGVLTPCVRGLTWAAGRVGVEDDALAAVAAARPDDPAYRPIRREAIIALAERPASPAVVAALEQAAPAGDPDVRGIAAGALARLDPGRAAAIAGRLLDDAVGWRRLTRGGAVAVESVLRQAAGQVHHQGVALPALIDRHEVETLTGVLADRKRPEAARLGALEGLGAMALEDAEAALRRVGADESEEDEVRKAAWRALRRSRRARAKVAAEVKP